MGYVPNKILKEDWLKEIAGKFSVNSVEDLYASLGHGNIKINQVITKLKDYYYKVYKEELEEKVLEEKLKKPQQPRKQRMTKSSQGITVKGVDNIKVRFAKCCNPVPGDEVIGFVTMGRGYLSIGQTVLTSTRKNTRKDSLK